jgi:hypothetical protein
VKDEDARAATPKQKSATQPLVRQDMLLLTVSLNPPTLQQPTTSVDDANFDEKCLRLFKVANRLC